MTNQSLPVADFTHKLLKNKDYFMFKLVKDNIAEFLGFWTYSGKDNRFTYPSSIKKEIRIYPNENTGYEAFDVFVLFNEYQEEYQDYIDKLKKIIRRQMLIAYNSKSTELKLEKFEDLDFKNIVDKCETLLARNPFIKKHCPQFVKIIKEQVILNNPELNINNLNDHIDELFIKINEDKKLQKLNKQLKIHWFTTIIKRDFEKLLPKIQNLYLVQKEQKEQKEQ